MENKVKGVNLGGWLVLEKWMDPHLFDHTKADDEYYLAHDLPADTYQARIEQHRANFITEADFLHIASLGFNLVRLPVPYFVFGDRAPFIGAIDCVDKAFNWAEAYGLKVLLDLHTAPDGQNGFDNGGISGVCKWASEPDEVEFEKSVAARLAKRYGNRPGLFGIEVLNEPAATKEIFDDMKRRYPPRDAGMAAGSAPISFNFLCHYYLDCYQRLRSILPADKRIVFHDGFALNKWKSFFTSHNFHNVILDTHQYLTGIETTDHDAFIRACQNKLKQLVRQIDEVSQYVPVMTGEWSLFNSYAAGINTQGGINPTQHQFAGATHHNQAQLQAIYQRLWDKQTAAWNHGIGSIYWTYKLNIDTINEPAWYGWDCWALQRAVDKHWISFKQG